MDNVNEKIAAIVNAEKNKQSCPWCGAPFTELGGSNGEIITGHACDCLIMLVMERDFEELGEDHILFNSDDEGNQPEQFTQAFDWEPGTIILPNKIYKKPCHHCGRSDGVNNMLPGCIEDPPYKYKCIHCGHSLRTHELFGQGKKFDMAMFNRVWTFDQNGNPITIHCSIKKEGKNIVY